MSKSSVYLRVASCAWKRQRERERERERERFAVGNLSGFENALVQPNQR
jgi:hypothetical protein